MRMQQAIPNRIESPQTEQLNARHTSGLSYDRWCSLERNYHALSDSHEKSTFLKTITASDNDDITTCVWCCVTLKKQEINPPGTFHSLDAKLYRSGAYRTLNRLLTHADIVPFSRLESFDDVAQLYTLLSRLELWQGTSLDLAQYGASGFRSRNNVTIPGTGLPVRLSVSAVPLRHTSGAPENVSASTYALDITNKKSHYKYILYQDTPHAITVTMPRAPLGENAREFFATHPLEALSATHNYHAFSKLLKSAPQGVIGFTPTMGGYALIKQIQGINLIRAHSPSGLSTDPPFLTTYFALHPLILKCALHVLHDIGFKGVLMGDVRSIRWAQTGGPLPLERAKAIYIKTTTLAVGPYGERFETVDAAARNLDRDLDISGASDGNRFLRFRKTPTSLF
jgi:hypothetical protein